MDKKNRKVFWDFQNSPENLIEPIKNGAFAPLCIMYERLNLLWNHCDVTARALLSTNTTTLAVVVVELIALTRTKLNNSAIRADTVAVVALHAVTAG